MTLRKNRYYALTMNGKTTIELYTGQTYFGYRFITSNNGSCIMLGINALKECSPQIVEKKVAKKFLSIK